MKPCGCPSAGTVLMPLQLLPWHETTPLRSPPKLIVICAEVSAPGPLLLFVMLYRSVVVPPLSTWPLRSVIATFGVAAFAGAPSTSAPAAEVTRTTAARIIHARWCVLTLHAPSGTFNARGSHAARIAATMPCPQSVARPRGGGLCASVESYRPARPRHVAQSSRVSS